MKACVITLHTVNNYGSVLQTYATSKILESLGVEVEIIDYWRKNNSPKALAERKLNSKSLQRIKYIWGINSITEWVMIRLLILIDALKRNRFQHFLKKRVHLSTERYESYSALVYNAPQGDVFITGSDQVWNSTWNDGVDRAFFLDFAPKNKPKIAFSSSIGKTEFDEDEIDIIKPLLEQYKAISVREQSAVDLLKKIGINSTLVLDPTLLIERNEWKKIEDTSLVPTKSYVLLYQLHDCENFDDYAQQVSNAYQCKIIRIGFSRIDKKRIGKCLYHVSVEQFLGLINHASCVMTDSFHATAFSLSFGVDFISIIPKEFGTRIQSITNLTGTDHRVIKPDTKKEMIPLVAKQRIDKTKVEIILDSKRKEAMDFLVKSLFQ